MNSVMRDFYIPGEDSFESIGFKHASTTADGMMIFINESNNDRILYDQQSQLFSIHRMFKHFRGHLESKEEVEEMVNILSRARYD